MVDMTNAILERDSDMTITMDCRALLRRARNDGKNIAS